MFKFFASIAIAVTLLATSAQAASIQNINHVTLAPGLKIATIGYCNGKDSAKGLSAAIALSGEKGFNEYMMTEGNRCYVQGLHNIATIFVTVQGKAWEVLDPEGSLFEFWKIQDVGGSVGYIWTNTSRKHTNEPETPLKTKPKKGRGA